ncbi:hypothetical protein [Nostocoides sp. HKS02]|uniref:hypothetical protein n=1 Tax=Nostocoides sp. HKS02 TaxID=1813880 RepID=UPI001E30E6B3|nr:hypothetical protein [Tetrasphaera sp. HKS02]
MSTLTTSPTTSRHPAARPTTVTQARVILSEWTKPRSLRSTVFSLAAAVLVHRRLGGPRPDGHGQPLATAQPR